MLPTSTLGVASSPNARPAQWHFAHLGREYFSPIARAHRDARLPPLEFVWTGRLGVAYDQKALGRRVNPNWMIEVEGGAIYIKRGGLLVRGEYDRGDVIRWTWREITERFGRLV